MELKEGMYVRTKYNDFCNMVAIRKIDEFDDDGSFWIDDYIIDTYGDEQNKLHEEDVEFASEDIVNVIKPGDYVNGYLVTAVSKDVYGETIVFVGQRLIEEAGYYRSYYSKDIKTIVTKEQFENMAYKIEKEQI